jgi:hypothetical protein
LRKARSASRWVEEGAQRLVRKSVVSGQAAAPAEPEKGVNVGSGCWCEGDGVAECFEFADVLAFAGGW